MEGAGGEALLVLITYSMLSWDHRVMCQSVGGPVLEQSCMVSSSSDLYYMYSNLLLVNFM